MRREDERQACLLIIQCDFGHADGDLIACARYRIYDMRAKALLQFSSGLSHTTHVLFIIHLPVQAVQSSFVGFQGDPWVSCHIDELRRSGEGTLTLEVAQGAPISELFYGGRRKDRAPSPEVEGEVSQFAKGLEEMMFHRVTSREEGEDVEMEEEEEGEKEREGEVESDMQVVDIEEEEEEEGKREEKEEEKEGEGEEGESDMQVVDIEEEEEEEGKREEKKEEEKEEKEEGESEEEKEGEEEEEMVGVSESGERTEQDQMVQSKQDSEVEEQEEATEEAMEEGEAEKEEDDVEREGPIRPTRGGEREEEVARQMYTQCTRLNSCIQAAASKLQDSTQNKHRATKRVELLIDHVPQMPSFPLGEWPLSPG